MTVELIPPRAGRNWLRLFLGAMLWAAAAAAPLVLDDNQIFVMTSGLLVSISVLGLQVLGWTGRTSLAQAGMTGLGMSMVFYAGRSFDGAGPGPRWNWPAAFGLALVVPTLLSLVLGLVAGRLGAAQVVVLSFATQFLISSYVFTQTRFSGFMESTVQRPAPWGLSVESDGQFYGLVLTVLGCVMLCLFRLERTRFGRALRAVGADARGAAVTGISPWRARVGAFAVCGALAGLAGALSCYQLRTPSPVEFRYAPLVSVLYAATATCAGRGSMLATVLVSVGLPAAAPFLDERALNFYLVLGAVTAVVLALHPRGISGLTDHLARRRTSPG